MGMYAPKTSMLPTFKLYPIPPAPKRQKWLDDLSFFSDLLAVRRYSKWKNLPGIACNRRGHVWAKWSDCMLDNFTEYDTTKPSNPLGLNQKCPVRAKQYSRPCLRRGFAAGNGPLLAPASCKAGSVQNLRRNYAK